MTKIYQWETSTGTFNSQAEKDLQLIEELLNKLNLKIEFYQNEIKIVHNNTTYKLVNLDCGLPSKVYELPRVTDGDRLIMDED